MYRLIAAIAVALCLNATDAWGGDVGVWLTTADGRMNVQRQQDIASKTPARSTVRITINADRQYQHITGFGAALTDSSTHLISTRLSAEGQQALLRELFGPEPGIGLSMVRITVGASDYALSHYTYDDVEAGSRDPDLSHFTIAQAQRELLPTLRAVLAVNPDVRVVAAPWSAPAWMKTTGNLVRGTLREDAYAAYAEYLSRYVAAMKAEGVPVWAMSIQNEPDFEPADYPGMRLSANARTAVIGQYLGPQLARMKANTKILEWDHNWDKPEQPLAVLKNADAARYVSAVAWHCYNGDVSAMSVVHDAHPDVETYLTECSGGEWAPHFGDNLRWMARNLIIDAARNWASGVILWNLALDENHGPHSGGCNDCRGVVTIDSRTGSVTRNVEYSVLAHASRFVRPGAVRVDSGAEADGLAHVAFRNLDGTMALIVLNDDKKDKHVSVQCGQQVFSATIPAGGLATFVW